MHIAESDKPQGATYVVLLPRPDSEFGERIHIAATEFEVPTDDRPWLVFRRGEETVAEFHRDAIKAWWML